MAPPKTERPGAGQQQQPDGPPQLFDHPVYTREVTTWLQRAKPEDLGRFDRVFGAADPEATADLGATAARITAAQAQPFSLIATQPSAMPGSPSGMGSPTPHGKPPRPQHAHGWTYASTKVAQTRPTQSPTNFNRSSSWDASTTASGAPRPDHESEPDQIVPRNQRHVTIELPGGGGRRPSSAPGSGDPSRPKAGHRGSGPGSGPSHAHEQQGHRPPTPYGPGAGSGAVQQQGQGEAATLPPMTTYTLAYNARDMYPEVYDKAIANTRSEQAPNFNFVSDWGDSLKANVDNEWRKKFMKSTYTAANDEVVSYDLNFDVTKERAFFEWMQKQKTYYGDLLTQEPKAQLEAQLVSAPVEHKREILNGLRQVYAVARPEDLKSHSQVVHCPMSKTEDPQLTALVTEQVCVKTMGRPLPTIRPEDLPPPGKPMPPQPLLPARPASASAARVDLTFEGPGSASGGRPVSASGMPHAALRKSASAGSGGARGGLGSAGPARPLTAAAPKPKKEKRPAVIETHTSKVPMAWPGFLATSSQSAYADAFGSLSQLDGPRPASASKQYQAIRIKETTCPMGAVNPHTAISQRRSAYPVPEGYVQKPAFPQPFDDKTIYRTDFYTRAEEDTVRSMRDAAVTSGFSRAETYKVTLPMGKNGLDTYSSAQWKTDQQANYVKHTWDIAEDRARAERLKAALSGPTASTGRLTARHMTTAARRQAEAAEKQAVDDAMRLGRTA